MILHTRSDRPRGPPNLLYNGYLFSLPGVKWSGCGTADKFTNFICLLSRIYGSPSLLEHEGNVLAFMG